MERPFPPLSVRPGPDVHALAALLVDASPQLQFSPAEAETYTENARRHAVAPMLYRQLRHAGVNLNAPEWETLCIAHDKQIQRYLKGKAAISKLERTLRAAEIPSIWLKGFSLAHTVYPNPILRPMRDLDVLVPFASRERALALAIAAGYTQDIPPHSEAMQAMWHHYHLGGPFPLELHYALIGLRSKILAPEQFAWFWTQTRQIQHDDLTFTAFTPEVELLYLSAHAILQHGETDFLLHRYLDLHLLLEKNQSLDWSLIVERAVQLRWTYAVQRALELTREYFATPIPAHLMEELRTRRPADEDADNVFRIHPDSTRLEVTQNLMRDMNRNERWKWFWGSLFPTPAYMQWRYHIRSLRQLPLFYLYRWGIIASDTMQTMLKWLRTR